MVRLVSLEDEPNVNALLNEANKCINAAETVAFYGWYEIFDASLNYVVSHKDLDQSLNVNRWKPCPAMFFLDGNGAVNRWGICVFICRFFDILQMEFLSSVLKCMMYIVPCRLRCITGT